MADARPRRHRDLGKQSEGVQSDSPYYPLILGLIGLIEFSDTVGDMINGTHDFDTLGDGENALAVFITGSVIAGAASTWMTALWVVPWHVARTRLDERRFYRVWAPPLRRLRRGQGHHHRRRWWPSTVVETRADFTDNDDGATDTDDPECDPSADGYDGTEDVPDDMGPPQDPPPP